ncbi:MAG: hypothetical protein ABI831_09235 [Betaproteobacteria bacterium]
MRLNMDDYGRAAKTHWWVVAVLGAVALSLALLDVATREAGTVMWIAVAAAVAAFTGMLRIPGSRPSVAGADIFVFLAFFQFGPAAAVIAAAAEAAVGSWRTSTRWTSRLGSPAMVALAMSVCGAA